MSVSILAGGFGALNLLDGLLNSVVDLVLDICKSRPAIQLLLHDLIRLQKLLQLIRQLEVLLRYHLHVSSEFSDLPLLLPGCLLELIGLLVDELPVAVKSRDLHLKLLKFLCAIARLQIEFVRATHLILKSLSQLRLRVRVFSVLVLKVADLLVNLAQLILQLLHRVLSVRKLVK